MIAGGRQGEVPLLLPERQQRRFARSGGAQELRGWLGSAVR